MMSSMEFELFLDTFSPLQYLRLCQPDRMTEGRDSNFFGFLRTTFLYMKDKYWTLTLVEVVLFHLSLLVLILRCLQRWDTPPPSGIPWNCVTHKFIESVKTPCCWSRLQSFPLPPQHCCYFPSLPPIPHIWDINSIHPQLFHPAPISGTYQSQLLSSYATICLLKMFFEPMQNKV